MLDGILKDVEATKYQIYLSDNKESNWRFQIYPAYKANRVAPKPKWHEELKEHLITKWGAEFSYGMEADDSLGIAQIYPKYIANNILLSVPKESWTVICSIDKDLLQVPGLHWNFVKKEQKFVTPEEGLRFFYSQILIGDTADNVKGAKGIGPVRAAKVLDGIEAVPAKLCTATYQAYCKAEKDKDPQKILNHILTVGRVLKIKQYEDEELWQLPIPMEQLMMETPPRSSTRGTGAENAPSTEQSGPETGGVGSCVSGMKTGSESTSQGPTATT